MSTTEPETWVPLEAADLVFSTREDGRFVAYSDLRGTFGAIVRRREGIWKKRMSHMTLVPPLILRDLCVARRYKPGAEFLAHAYAA